MFFKGIAIFLSSYENIDVELINQRGWTNSTFGSPSFDFNHMGEYKTLNIEIVNSPIYKINSLPSPPESPSRRPSTPCSSS